MDCEAYCDFILRNPAHSFTPPKDVRSRKKIHSAKDIEKELKGRDLAFSEIRHKGIHEENYEFDPFVFMTDKKIQKGGILQALRDSCKD